MTALGRAVGLIDRNGFDATSKTYLTWNNAAFNPILGGVVQNLNWSQLQTAAGSPPGSHALASAGTQYIDAIFNQADAYNNTNPTLYGTTTPLLWTIVLRIFAGEYAPSWAQSLRSGPITLSGATGPGTVGEWWTSDYISAYENFMNVLAAYVPSYTVRSVTSSGGLPVGANTQPLAGHPLLGLLCWAPTMTLYAETCSKDDAKGGYNSPANGGVWTPANGSLPSGDQYSLATDEAALTGTISTDTHTAQSIWAASSTPVAISYTPYVQITGTGKNNLEAETESLIASWESSLSWPYNVLENNSLTASGLTYPPANGSNPGAYVDGKSYQAMYTKMCGYGPSQLFKTAMALGAVQASPAPIHIQTNTFISNSWLLATLSYAAWLGARAVELPGGYGGLTLAQLASGWTVGGGGTGVGIPALIANDPTPGSLPVNTVPGIRHWRAYRHH